MLVSNDTDGFPFTPAVSSRRDEVCCSKDDHADEWTYRDHYQAVVEVHVKDALGSEYPSEIEVDDVNNVQKPLIHSWVRNIRDSNKLQMESTGHMSDDKEGSLELG